jgi:hypothetical protein
MASRVIRRRRDAYEKADRRMTLRQLLDNAEKYLRDLTEHINDTFFPEIANFRALTRPVRRKSSYPKMTTLAKAIRTLKKTANDIDGSIEHLVEQMQYILGHTQR